MLRYAQPWQAETGKKDKGSFLLLRIWNEDAAVNCSLAGHGPRRMACLVAGSTTGTTGWVARYDAVFKVFLLETGYQQ